MKKTYEKWIQQVSEETSTIPSTTVKKAVNRSKWKLMLGTLTLFLLILPMMYLFTYYYYAFGTKSTTLMEVAHQTVYVTEPNVALKPMETEMEFSPFTMKLQYEGWKQIGKEWLPVKTYDTTFTLGQATKQNVTSSLQKRPESKYPQEQSAWLAHPLNAVPFETPREWEKVRGLPDGTVVEAYVSFHHLMSVEKVKQMLPNVDVVWAAIDTGVEETMLSEDGNVVSPLGYHVQRQEDIPWSPYREDVDHEEVFLNILTYLEKHEREATFLSSHKALALKERIQYLKKQQGPMQTYGVVITGPKKEIEALQEEQRIREMKVGEVMLWNWYDIES